MKSNEVKSLFTVAGFEVLEMKALVDGYNYHPDDGRFTQTLPRCAWWFVKTTYGWIEFGERKSVFSIDWKDTGLSAADLTTDHVTRDEFLIHAWTNIKALEYLQSLRFRLSERPRRHKESMLQVAEAALEYINAIPRHVAKQFPAMPRFDREWANEVVAEARAEK